MKVLGTLDRYVIRSVAVPAFLAFVVYTFLLMMRPMFRLIEQVFVRGLPVEDAMKIVLVSMPHIIVLTIPLSYLFGVLIAVGRMNADNEIIALQAGGVRALRLLPPIMLVALVMASVNGFLFLETIPHTNQRLKDIRRSAFSSSKKIGRIEPGVFYEDFPNILLYVDEIERETGIWNRVLIYDSNETEERLTLAKHGQLLRTPEEQSEFAEDSTKLENSGEPWLFLRDVVSYQFVPNKPSTSRFNSIQSHMLKIPTGKGNVTYSPEIRERKTSELIDLLRAPPPATNSAPQDEVDDRRLAAIELHRRISIPFASIVFALLALPLGIGSGASGKGRGFVMSIIVVLAYFVMSSNGEMFALKGKIPVWLGMWFPNIALTLLSLFLMRKMAKWLGERQRRDNAIVRFAKTGGTWIRERLEARQYKKRGFQLTGSIPIHIQRRRYSGTFPTLLDRHLTQRLLLPLLLVLSSTAAINIVVDLSGKLDDMVKNRISFDIIIAYYFKLIPQVILDVIPMALMIAVLILVTVLERQHELTALKSAGVSLYRVMLPVLLVALLSIPVLWFLEESIVPSANREAKRLLRIIKGQDQNRSYRAGDRMWLLSRDKSTFYKFLRYDAETQSLARFTMFTCDEDLNLLYQLSAHRITYSDGHWSAETNSGWFREFLPDGHDEFRRITSSMKLKIPEGPDYFGQEFRSPAEMAPDELKDYIQELHESGYRPSKLMVRWHQKYVYPLSGLVFVLLALPFGLNRGGQRISTMQGVGIALGLGIGYFLIVALLGKMGEADLLPPAVGAWAPFLLASLFAINRISGLRT